MTVFKYNPPVFPPCTFGKVISLKAQLFYSYCLRFWWLTIFLYPTSSNMSHGGEEHETASLPRLLHIIHHRSSLSSQHGDHLKHINTTMENLTFWKAHFLLADIFGILNVYWHSSWDFVAGFFFGLFTYYISPWRNYLNQQTTH